MGKLEELEAIYSSNMTEKEKAELEAQIWALAPRQGKHGLAAYINRRFKAGSSSASSRQYLHRLGAIANPLWARIQKDMTLTTAASLMREARNLVDADSTISIEEGITKCIEKYDSSGYAARNAAGKVTRRKLPSSIRRPPFIASQPPQQFAPSGRAFWNHLRAQIGEYIESRLQGADPRIRERLLQRFETDLNLLFEDFQGELSRAPKVGLEIAIVSRRAVIQACRALGMDPPKPGKPVDLKHAATQRKRYARMYHPDVHGGSEETVPLYQAAMDAFKILEQYNVNFTISDVKLTENGDSSATRNGGSNA